MNNQWACEACFPNAVEAGNLDDSMYVIYNDGKWSLLSGGGHKDDILVTFNTPPSPEPDTGSDDDLNANTPEAEALWNTWNSWFDEANEAMKGFLDGYDLRSAWRIVEALIQIGYKPDDIGDIDDGGIENDGTCEIWLYGQVGEVVAKWRETIKT